MKILLILFVLLVSCEKPKPAYKDAIDLRLKRELFCECLKNVPKSPETMGKSDWSKIVSECSSYAHYASFRVVPTDSVVGGMVK